MPRDLFPDLTINRIAPGEYCSMRQGGIISTLLGSCVAACLYDSVNGIAGMNHFMLTSRRYSKKLPFFEAESGRYGNYAMELLINDMLKAGASRGQLRAKVFGGAAILRKSEVMDNFACVGSVNCRFIEEFLTAERIPLVTSDLGGEQGRIIYFDTRDYSVYVRKIKRTHSVKVAERDHSVWQREIRKHEHRHVPDVTTAENVELWI